MLGVLDAHDTGEGLVDLDVADRIELLELLDVDGIADEAAADDVAHGDLADAHVDASTLEIEAELLDGAVDLFDAGAANHRTLASREHLDGENIVLDGTKAHGGGRKPRLAEAEGASRGAHELEETDVVIHFPKGVGVLERLVEFLEFAIALLDVGFRDEADDADRVVDDRRTALVGAEVVAAVGLEGAEQIQVLSREQRHFFQGEKK